MTMTKDSILDPVTSGHRLDDEQALALVGFEDTGALMEVARCVRDRRSGDVVTYSPKVFIPLTELCRDVCRYCTFAKTPGNVRAPYLAVDEAVDIARRGAAAGCTEALFTLGDQPERRYRTAREALAGMGFESTIDYLAHAARRVHEETGLLPHVNPGVMSREELARLREVSVSAGIMLESTSRRLCEKGGPHYGSPDKDPEVRLATLERAGRAGGAVHHRDPHRDRRDPARTRRVVARHPRSGGAVRPHPGGDRAELPGQARHPNGGGARALARGPPVDHRGGAARPGAGNERPGAAEPSSRCARPPRRCGARRLGWGVAGDPRSREPGGAVAASDRAWSVPRNRGASRSLRDCPSIRGSWPTSNGGSIPGSAAQCSPRATARGSGARRGGLRETRSRRLSAPSPWTMRVSGTKRFPVGDPEAGHRPTPWRMAAEGPTAIRTGPRGALCTRIRMFRPASDRCRGRNRRAASDTRGDNRDASRRA